MVVEKKRKKEEKRMCATSAAHCFPHCLPLFENVHTLATILNKYNQTII